MEGDEGCRSSVDSGKEELTISPHAEFPPTEAMWNGCWGKQLSSVRAREHSARPLRLVAVLIDSCDRRAARWTERAGGRSRRREDVEPEEAKRRWETMDRRAQQSETKDCETIYRHRNDSLRPFVITSSNRWITIGRVRNKSDVAKRSIDLARWQGQVSSIKDESCRISFRIWQIFKQKFCVRVQASWKWVRNPQI